MISRLVQQSDSFIDVQVNHLLIFEFNVVHSISTHTFGLHLIQSSFSRIVSIKSMVLFARNIFLRNSIATKILSSKGDGVSASGSVLIPSRFEFRSLNQLLHESNSISSLFCFLVQLLCWIIHEQSLRYRSLPQVAMINGYPTRHMKIFLFLLVNKGIVRSSVGSYRVQESGVVFSLSLGSHSHLFSRIFRGYLWIKMGFCGRVLIGRFCLAPD